MDTSPWDDVGAPFTIRPLQESDDDALWPMLREMLQQGETYALPPDMSREAAWSYWALTPRATFVAELDGELLGSYYLKANAAGPGDHVCNCGYLVGRAARGRGVAGWLCRHSLAVGRALGFAAMQFNSVVSTNEGAVRCWEREGFRIVGTLPGAFRHPRLGRVDCYVMFREL